MKTLLILSAFLSTFIICKSQTTGGLEKILVETYYISDANDATQNSVGGILPVGSKTYRIYVDMKPGYKFQAAYGIPGHELRIATTTLFFNNEDRGDITPNFTKNQARNNTVMLDSWLSVGAACEGQFGVLKSQDDNILTNVNLDGVLQNNNPEAGIPITQRDGYLPGNPTGVTLVGLDVPAAVFNNQNNGTNGPVFSTFNGSWAALGGSNVFNSDSNQVLIAQITTNGQLSFELNIQIAFQNIIGIDTFNVVENYVALNPGPGELSIPSLIYPQVINCNAFSITPTPLQPTCGLPNGSISIEVSNSNTPYIYNWNNGSTSSVIQNLVQGNYSVTVTDGNGCTASGSTTLNNSICPKINAQSVVSLISQTGATISWPAVSCAAKYRVVVKNVSTGVQTTTLVTAPNTTLNLSGLQPNTTYQVRIRTQCSQNGTVVSQLSPIRSFTTLNNQGIQCLPPSNVSISNITATTAQINWTPAAGAIQYNLRYRKLGTTTWVNTVISSGLASSITVQGLSNSTTYEFQLRTKCNSNPDEFSPYSAVFTFVTPAQRIEEIEALRTLIYPNPTNNNINVVINTVSETQTTIRITDLLGRVLLNETEELLSGNNTITYNIGEYAAGVYLVHVGNGNTQQVYKVVKE
jgi:hypothetical protein